MTTERIDLARALCEAYARNSGNDFKDHFNTRAAVIWMGQALEEVGVAELIEAAKDEQAQACGNFKAKSCGHDGYCICPGNRLRAVLVRVGAP